MLIPNSRSDKAKFSRVANPIQITDILVSQKQGMGEYDQPNKYATTENYLKRIKYQMRLHAAIANAEHESMNFEQDPFNSTQMIMKQGKENEIVRLTSNEFFFYPAEDLSTGKPLSQKEFQKIVETAVEIGKNCHENLHLVFASFPVEGPNKQIHNMVIHVQCGMNPQVSTFAKSFPSDQDAIYKEKENRYFVNSLSDVPDILNNGIDVGGQYRTMDEVINHISTYGLNRNDIYNEKVRDWLLATQAIIKYDSNYPAPDSLILCLDELYKKLSRNQPLIQSEIDSFKKEMYAYKQQLLEVFGRIDVPSTGKKLNEMVEEIEKNLTSPVTRDMALQQLAYLEDNLILPLDYITTDINNIRTGTMIANYIDSYNTSMSQIANIIDRGETVDGKTYQKFIENHTDLRFLLKTTYINQKMSQKYIDEELIKFDAGLDVVLQKIGHQQHIFRYETSLQALDERVKNKDYQGGENENLQINQNAEEFSRILTVLIEDLTHIYKINELEIQKFKSIFDSLLKKINDNDFNDSDTVEFEQAVIELNSVFDLVKKIDELNREDIEKFIEAKVERDKALKKLESTGSDLRNVSSLKDSINRYQRKGVVERLSENLFNSSVIELTKLAKQYKALRDEFEIFKLIDLSKFGNDLDTRNSHLNELLIEHRKQLIPLLEKMKRTSELASRPDINFFASDILDSPTVIEKLFYDFDRAVKSIEIDDNIFSQKTKSTDEMIKFLNFIESIENLDVKAKKNVADLKKHLQDETLDKSTLAKFITDTKPYQDLLENELRYWNFPDQSSNKGFNHNSTIKCKSAGGTEFYTALEVCLDHLYEIAKHNLDKTMSSSSDVSPLQVSHLITSDTVQRDPNKFFTPYVTHADRDNEEMGVYETSTQNRLPPEDFSPDIANVQIRTEYERPQIEVRDNKLIIIDPYFGPSELEFYKSPSHKLEPLALNGKQSSKDSYTREYYINKIEKLLLMAKDQVHARDQLDEINQFMARLNDLKSDITLSGKKLLGELNAFKERISNLEKSNLLVQRIEEIEYFITKKLLPPKAFCALVIKNMLINSNLQYFPQEQASLIRDLVRDLIELSRRPSNGVDFIQMVSEYREKATTLGESQGIEYLNNKLNDVEKEIYERLLPNEYKAKYVDHVQLEESSSISNGLRHQGQY